MERSKGGPSWEAALNSRRHEATSADGYPDAWWPEMGSGGGRRGPSGMTRTYDGYCGYHSASILVGHV